MVTNLINGKKYIGQTARTLSARWKSHLSSARNGSMTFFHQHIRECGEASFDVEQLGVAVGTKAADEMESFYIETLKTSDSQFGYNRALGGANGKRGAECVAAMSHRMKGNRNGVNFKPSQEHREKLRQSRLGKPGWALGRKFTESHRAAMSDAWKKRKGYAVSAETRAKISAAKKGKPMPKEAARKAAISRTGLKRSEETKAKMAESRRKWWEAKRQANQQFGESQ